MMVQDTHPARLPSQELGCVWGYKERTRITRRFWRGSGMRLSWLRGCMHARSRTKGKKNMFIAKSAKVLMRMYACMHACVRVHM
jgi:hypothetical protein